MWGVSVVVPLWSAAAEERKPRKVHDARASYVLFLQSVHLKFVGRSNVRIRNTGRMSEVAKLAFICVILSTQPRCWSSKHHDNVSNSLFV